jgi:antitoxin VapB
MTLHIKNFEADTLARELADRLNTSVTEAVVMALREKLDAERRRASPASARRDAIRAIQQRVAAAPLLDTRSDDDIIGYDDHGLPA